MASHETASPAHHICSQLLRAFSLSEAPYVETHFSIMGQERSHRSVHISSTGPNGTSKISCRAYSGTTSRGIRGRSMAATCWACWLSHTSPYWLRDIWHVQSLLTYHLSPTTVLELQTLMGNVAFPSLTVPASATAEIGAPHSEGGPSPQLLHAAVRTDVRLGVSQRTCQIMR